MIFSDFERNRPENRWYFTILSNGSNIFRVFFFFDNGNVAMLFNGFMFLRILSALGLRFEVLQPLANG